MKVGGSGNIDFTYKFMEDVNGIKFPFTGTSPITGYFNIIVFAKMPSQDGLIKWSLLAVRIFYHPVLGTKLF